MYIAEGSVRVRGSHAVLLRIEVLERSLLFTTRPKRLRLEEEFDRDGDVGGNWLSVAGGWFVLVLLEGCDGGAL